MTTVFVQLLRQNFRFGRMLYSRTEQRTGRLAGPVAA